MDIISNRLTSIRNGQQAGLVMVKIPFSSTNVNIEKNKLFSILNILRDEGYIRGFSYKIGNSLYNKQCIMIYLKYDSQGNGIIKAITRISTPGRRVYINTASLWQPQSTTGIFIMSTVQGYLSDQEARKKNLGGEVLFSIV